MVRKLSFRFSVNFLMILGFISTVCVFVFGGLSPVAFFVSFVIVVVGLVVVVVGFVVVVVVFVVVVAAPE